MNNEELLCSVSAWRSLGICERSAWSASRPVVLWHFLVLHYCVGHHFRAFVDHWVSGSLIGAMCVPLHVLVVFLCSASRGRNIKKIFFLRILNNVVTFMLRSQCVAMFIIRNSSNSRSMAFHLLRPVCIYGNSQTDLSVT